MKRLSKSNIRSLKIRAHRQNFYFLFFLFFFIPIGGLWAKLETHRLKVGTKYGSSEFDIIASDQAQALLLETKRILSTDGVNLMNLMEYAPRDLVSIVLEPDLLTSNGWASVFPDSRVVLYDYPPMGLGQLSFAHQWWRILLVHELMHIIHMDQTSDFQQVLRSIFGSIGKWSGVTPRWFAEGVAVWAESQITGHGRLGDPVLRSLFYAQIQSGAFCDSVDCLDDFGIFPHGSLAYWAGGYFFEYLENLHPGGIKCLLKTNSGTLPFFLNNAFKQCMGSEASTLYSSFIHSIKPKAQSLPLDFLKRQKFEKLYSGRALLDKGLISLFDEAGGEVLIYSQIELVQGRPSLSKGRYYPKGAVDYLQGWPDKNQALIYQSYSKGKGEGHELALVTNGKMTSLGWARDPWYFPDARGFWWSLRYESPRFHLVFFNTTEIEKALNLQGEIYYSFEEMENIRRAHWVGEKLVFSSSRAEDGRESLSWLDILTKKRSSMVSIEGNLRPYGQCVNTLWWADNRWVYRFDGQIGNFLKKELPKNDLHYWGTKNWGLTLDRDLGKRETWEKGSCVDSGSQNWQEIGGSSGQKILLTKASEVEEEKLSYPQMRHFLPHYWIPRFQIANEVENFFGLQTSLQDPKEFFHLDLGGQYHPEAGQFGYDLGPGLNLGDWYLNANLSHQIREYSKKNYTENDFYYFNTSYQLSHARWTFVPTISYGKSVVEDILGRRDERRVGPHFALNYQSTNESFFLQKFLGSFSFFNQKVEAIGSNHEYGGGLGQTLFVFRPFSFWRSLTSFQYGRLGKSGTQDGVFMGGGPGAINGGGATIEFLPLSYGSLYGNEFVFGSMELDYEYDSWGRGPDLFPMFWREGHLFGGAQMVRTDYAFIEGSYLYQKTLTSAYLGLRSHLTIFYRVPLVADITYATVVNSGINEFQWLFLIKSDWF